MEYRFRIRVHRGLAHMLLYDRSEQGLKLRETMRSQFPHFRTTGDQGSLNFCYVTANIADDKVPYLQTVLDAFAITPEAHEACAQYEEDTIKLCCAAARA